MYTTTLARPKSTNIPLYSFSDSESGILSFYVNNEGDIVDVDSSDDGVSIAPTTFGTSIRTPDIDSYLCVIYRKKEIVIQIGTPVKKVFMYIGEPKQTLSCSLYTLSGDTLFDGNLTEAKNGFYFVDVPYNYEIVVMIVEDQEYIVHTDVGDVASVESKSGVIKLQNNIWQLIAMPNSGGKVGEYFCDRLSSKYNTAPENLIEVCSAFMGKDNLFKSYIPSVTKKTTRNNFPLIHDDSGVKEVTAFWVKTKDMTSFVPDAENVTITWEWS